MERLGHPGQDGRRGDGVEDQRPAAGVPLGPHVELHAQARWDEPHRQEQPGADEDDQHEGHGHDHPGGEGDLVAPLGQCSQGDGVGRGAHRRADTADVGGHGYRQGQARPGPARGKGPEDGDDDGEHGG